MTSLFSSLSVRSIPSPSLPTLPIRYTSFLLVSLSLPPPFHTAFEMTQRCPRMALSSTHSLTLRHLKGGHLERLENLPGAEILLSIHARYIRPTANWITSIFSTAFEMTHTVSTGGAVHSLACRCWPPTDGVGALLTANPRRRDRRQKFRCHATRSNDISAHCAYHTDIHSQSTPSFS